MILRIPISRKSSLNLNNRDLLILGGVLLGIICCGTTFAIYKHYTSKVSYGASNQTINIPISGSGTCGGGQCHTSTALPKTPDNCNSPFCMPLYEPSQCQIDQSNYYKDLFDNHTPLSQAYQAYSQATIKHGCTPVPESGSSTDSDGYDAGYQFAEDNQICDTSYSDGNSDAFNQGVQDWASANCTDGQPN